MGFSVDNKILMFDGSVKNIGSLQIGDEIIGANSRPKIVEEIGVKKDVLYEIIPNKGTCESSSLCDEPSRRLLRSGTPYTVDANHVLLLKVSNYEMVWWHEQRKRYIVRWIANFAIKVKMFTVATYGYTKPSSKSLKNNFKNAKKQTYKIAKRFLRNEVPRIDGYVKYGDVVEIMVKDFIKLPKHVQAVYKNYSKGINFVRREIDVDPYLLGYWLGDGTSAKPEITTIEEEVIEKFEEYASENGMVLTKRGKYSHNISTGTSYGGNRRNSFMNFLRDYNIRNNKHIPEDYMRNSRENRLKLLAGLVDSDGCNNGNTYQFIFKSEKLADDVIFLAKTLGFRAFKNKVRKTCTNSRRGRVTGTYFQFFVHGEGIEKVPSLLERKQTYKRQTKRNASVSGIKIKPLSKSKYYNLRLHNGCKILLDDFTVVKC